MANYNILTEELEYFLQNTSEENNVGLSVFTFNCLTSEWDLIQDVIVPPLDTYSIDSFSGYTLLKIISEEPGATIDIGIGINSNSEEVPEGFITEDLYLNNFVKEISDLSKDLLQLFCGVVQQDCAPSISKCDMLLSASTKMHYLKAVLHQDVKDFYEVIRLAKYCKGKRLYEIDIETDMLNGKYSLKEYTLLYLLALDYIALVAYYKKEEVASFIPSFESMKIVLESDKLLSCIDSKLNITLQNFDFSSIGS